MGAGSWNPSDWKDYSSRTASKPVHEVYTTKGKAKTDLDPKGVVMRESRDSADNPESTAIVAVLDVTGSMGRIAHVIATKGLGTLFQEILDRKPVPNPHLMFMAVGDANYDVSPLQVSQFEADNRIIPQLTDIFLEGGGGRNGWESYNMAWYFAAMHTSIDCFEKRGKKGFLFTMGDEEVPGPLKKAQIEQFIGDQVERDYTSQELLEMASRTYHVFHIIIEEGSHCRGGYLDRVVSQWKDLMGQHVIRVSDYTKLAEVIVSTIQVVQGEDKADVAKSWSGDTSLVVQKAIGNLPANAATTSDLVRI